MRKRAVWVEPLFGEAKQWHGLRQFRLRGLAKVTTESSADRGGAEPQALAGRHRLGPPPRPCGALALPHGARRPARRRPHRAAPLPAAPSPRRPRDPRPLCCPRGVRQRADAWPFNPARPCGRSGWRCPAVGRQDPGGGSTPPGAPPWRQDDEDDRRRRTDRGDAPGREFCNGGAKTRRAVSVAQCRGGRRSGLVAGRSSLAAVPLKARPHLHGVKRPGRLLLRPAVGGRWGRGRSAPPPPPAGPRRWLRLTGPGARLCGGSRHGCERARTGRAPCSRRYGK